MRTPPLYIFVFFICLGTTFSQVRIVKPIKTHAKSSNLSFGIGTTRSVVYLARNVNDNNDAYGLNALIAYDRGNFIRVSLEYSIFNHLSIKPTWSNIKAQTLESNIYFIARTADKKMFFYPMVGISYNIFDGYFTGVNDYLNLRSIYEQNSTVTTRWFGLNAGFGADYNFKHGSLYLILLKMRVGNTVGFNEKNIQDVCFTLGYKINIKGATLYKLFRGTRSRYSLKTQGGS